MVVLARNSHNFRRRGDARARDDKAREGLGAEAYLQYIEHPNRVQRSQRTALQFRSRKLVGNVG